MSVYYQDDPSILKREQVNQVYNIHEKWMESIVKYLEITELPENELQAHRIRIKLVQYSMIGGQLYKRSYSGPYLRFFRPRKSEVCHFGIT